MTCALAVDWLLFAFTKGIEFLNSSFFLALVSSCLGAWGGAWAAQRGIEKAKLEQEAVREVRSANTAALIVFGIANRLFAFKSQVSIPTVKRFNDEKARVIQQKQQATPSEIHAILDLETMPPNDSGLAAVREIVTSQINSTSSTVLLMDILESSLSELNRLISARNELIDEFRNQKPITDYARINMYFGFSDQHGHVDARFAEVIDGVEKFTDDCLMFSLLLIESIKLVAETARKKAGKSAPRIIDADFDKAKRAGLIPVKENYSDWVALIDKDKARVN